MSTTKIPLLNAIVLAGGRSSRMGQDKALIPIDGTPLLLRTCQVAQRCADFVYVVTFWSDRYETLLNQAGAKIRLIQEVPFDQDQPHGPLVGFLQGLRQIETQAESDWVLLLACDLPRLQAEILQQWSATLHQVRPEIVALLPRNPQGWWEPLCGFYRYRCRSSLEAFVAPGGRAFQDWLTTQSVQDLPLANLAMLMNCNTPEDLQQVNK